jgi:uncharacterized coiled-coil DUF342 family protein
MRDIQEIFNEIQELKEEQKGIRAEYKDALANANEYEETTQKVIELREKKKQIESLTQSRLGSRYQKFEEIKNKINELNELLTDIAMNDLMAGKTISIKDKNANEYEPIYKITFKKRG